jgi:hypothetical protein
MAEMPCALVERLETIVDPRRQSENLKPRLVDLILVGFCGVRAGGEDCDCGLGASAGGVLCPFLALPQGAVP